MSAQAAIAIVVNGGPPLRGAAIVVRGRTLLPLRRLATVSGGTVDYDRASGTVTVRRGPRRTQLRVGTTTYLADGVPHRTDVAPRIVDGRTYAPLRIVAESLGALVDYDAVTRVVSLDVPQLAAGTNAPPVRANVAPPTIFDRRPQSGGHVQTAFPLVGVSIGTHGSELDPASLRLLFDGHDVSARASLVGGQYTFTPESPVYGGVHRVEVRGATVDGTPFDEQWSFLSDNGYAVTAPDVAPLGGLIVQPYTSGWNSMSFFLTAPPGGSGYVTLSGIPGFFPLFYRGGNTYVADVRLPYGLRVPYSQPTAYFTTSGGSRLAVPLNSTIYVNTATPPPVAPAGVPATPLPSPAATTHARRLLILPATTPLPSATPLTHTPPLPSATPLPHAPPLLQASPPPGHRAASPVPWTELRAIRIEPPAALTAPVHGEHVRQPLHEQHTPQPVREQHTPRPERHVERTPETNPR